MNINVTSIRADVTLGVISRYLRKLGENLQGTDSSIVAKDKISI